MSQGEDFSEYKVRKIMRENGFYPETVRKYKSCHIRTALGNEIARHKTGETIVFHSDRGSQYASQSYQRYLEENGIIGSMIRPGCPYDNSCVESFFATLKKERIYRRHYETEIELRQDMFKYVELFYNRKDRHSYLGYKSPVEYRNDYERNQVA